MRERALVNQLWPQIERRLNYVTPVITIDVRAYGAKLDGVTDNTVANQAAIDAADAMGGARVISPSGTNLTGNLTIGSYTELAGEGMGSTLKAIAGTRGNLLTLKTTTTVRVGIRDLHLDGNYTNCPGLGGIYLNNSGITTDSVHRLHNVIVENFADAGIYLGSSVRLAAVTECFVFVITTDAGFLIDGATDCVFSNCWAGSTYSHGFDIRSCNNHFIGCKAFWSGYDNVNSVWIAGKDGFHIGTEELYGNHNIHLVSCEAQETSRHGFTAIRMGPTEPVQSVHFIGCLADSNGVNGALSAGFNIDNGEYCQVLGCTAMNTTGLVGDTQYGIRLAGLCTGTVIGPNTIMNYGSTPTDLELDATDPPSGYTLVGAGGLTSGSGFIATDASEWALDLAWQATKGLSGWDMAAATSELIGGSVDGDSVWRFLMTADGKTNWGPGNAALDVNLFRSAADTLKTDDNLIVALSLAIQGSVGFYNTAPQTIQTVTGSRGGNAALASLLTALATIGLITDSSSA